LASIFAAPVCDIKIGKGSQIEWTNQKETHHAISLSSRLPPRDRLQLTNLRGAAEVKTDHEDF
jgi:hypothetical protein